MSTAIVLFNPDSPVNLDEVQIIAEEISAACISIPNYPVADVPMIVRILQEGELGGDALVIIHGVQDSFVEYGRTEREKQARIIFTDILGPYTRVGVHIILDTPPTNGENIAAGGGLNMRLEAARDRAFTRVMAYREKKAEELESAGSPSSV
jgi:hypothetical protein